MKQRYGMQTISENGRQGLIGRLLDALPLIFFVVLVADIVVLILAETLPIVLKIGLGFIAVVLVVLLLMMLQTSRRRKQSWRSEDILFEPELSRPISSIQEEREWNWPSHPVIRYPLAIGLIIFVYWVLVENRMKLPGQWLISLVLFALISLWCWREPLLLFLIVAFGVGVLALAGWMIKNLSVGAILGLLVLFAITMYVGIKELNKRKFKR